VSGINQASGLIFLYISANVVLFLKNTGPFKYLKNVFQRLNNSVGYLIESRYLLTLQKNTWRCFFFILVQNWRK
jgi:hypothetical protein